MAKDPEHKEAGSDRVRVAIIGGGCAGLATAWQLSQLNQERAVVQQRAEAGHPDALKRLASWPTYDISVYEASHRLGGKGASERDAHGRILEHGLHVWLGFYENAFRLMREAYAEAQNLGLGPDHADPGRRLAHARFEDAFRPEPHIGVASLRRDGRVDVWSGFLPPMKGAPGTPLDEGTNPYTWWGYAARALALVKALMLSTVGPASSATPASGARPGSRSALDEAQELDFDHDPLESPGALVGRLTRLLRVGGLTTAAALLQAVTLLENWMRDSNPPALQTARIFRLVEALATQARRQLRDVVTLDEELRRKTEILDLVMTIMVGLWRDRVYFSPQGLDKIDDIDYRTWLEKHGATRGAIESPLVTGIYDLVFGYRDGRHDRPALSAGQAIRGALRMFFTYRGSMFWRMNAGMGDVVFAPLFQVLVARGDVRFHFRHSLSTIDFDFDGKRARRVKSLTFEVAGSSKALTVAGLPSGWTGNKPQGPWPLDAGGCWPTAKRSSLPRGTPRTWTLDDGAFDAVVFAQGIDPFVKACGETAKPHQAATAPFFQNQKVWETMRRHVVTVATRSAQVWLDKNLDELGWDRGPVVVAGLGAGHEPVRHRGYETWADMTHTLAAERRHRWQSQGAHTPDRVRHVAYFCGVVDEDRVSAGQALGTARDDLKQLLTQGLSAFWPGPPQPGKQRKAVPLDVLGSLVSADGQAAHARHLKDQHVVVNETGSERYTQALPGSGTARVSPLDPMFDNATIAGDWTHAGFNGGCIETAVMSGLLAAHALSGRGDLNAIVGYHHP